MADLRCLLFIPLDKYLRTLKYTTQENTMASIGFIGVGKLGQACAEMVAEVHDVVGYDVMPREPENFTMVENLTDAVLGQDIVFVAVQTPHDPEYDGSAPTSHLPNKDFDYTLVKEVLSEVNQVATADQLIVLISTVLPGTVRREFIPLLTNTRFVYNPYLIAMGTVKWDMVNPEMVMIGTRDGSETGDAKELIDFYKTFMQNDPKYVVGTWDECECIKVFYNTFISAKVSLVNMIQDVAEKQGNINAEVVCDALATSDRRIMGPGYMKPGMGDGGVQNCLAILRRLAHQIRADHHARPGAVFHDQARRQEFGFLIGQQTCRNIRGAARGERHDNTARPAWPGLRQGWRSERRQRGGAGAAPCPARSASGPAAARREKVFAGIFVPARLRLLPAQWGFWPTQ